MNTHYDLIRKRIWVAGHRGMVGAAIVRRLATENCEVIVTEREEVDLTRQEEVEAWQRANRPDAIIIAAAKVGGIVANDTLPAEFLYNNMMIEANIIHAAHMCGIDRILFLGSSCIYPRMAEQPMKEEELLSGPLEPTNEWYAIAKIAGIKLCEAYRKQYGRDYISAQPSNLYGPHDNFHQEHSHVIPALIIKAHKAKLVDDYKGMTNLILKQRQDMSFLLHEAKFFLDEFKDNLSEEDFGKYERAADKKFQDWIKDQFEIDKVSVEVSLKGH